VINVTGAFFKARGEKWLRQNCGGNLAKDETYGFLVTDLVIGRRAPRTDATTLGEKLRKEHAKVKKREKEEKAKISKVPTPQREAARLAWDRELAGLLAAPCQNLPIPSAARCGAVLREEQKAADHESYTNPIRSQSRAHRITRTTCGCSSQRLRRRRRRLKISSSWASCARKGR
jgi:hypothetical protein